MKRRAPRLAKCNAMERPRPVPPPVRKIFLDFSRSDWNKSDPQIFQEIENSASNLANAYQILQACSRTMASPFLQPHASANAAISDNGPLPRKPARRCGVAVA